MAIIFRSGATRLRAVFLASTVLLLPTLASAAEGAWKHRTHVIWDSEAQLLIRKNLRVWDPHPELDLDFLWEQPRSLAPDPSDIVTGTGKLTWYVKGAASYSRQTIHSEYRGDMKNGRPEDMGSLVMRSGLSYEGSWKDGAMDGHGVIRFENGDHYEGDFAGNRMHGHGRYAAADGSVYVGDFRDGVRQGAGILTLADGLSYRTSWTAGLEVRREPIAPDADNPDGATALRLAQAAPGLSLRILVDRAKNEQFLKEDQQYKYYVYEGENAPGLLNVQLSSKRIMGVWKGDDTITTQVDLDSDEQFAPVFLAAEVANDSAQTARIVNAYLAVEKSASDLQPYLQMNAKPLDCEVGTYDPTWTFQNWGWGAVQNPKLIYTFGNKAARTSEFDLTMSTFDKKTSTVTVEEALRSAGVNISGIRRDNFTCSSVSRVPACLAELEKSGIFGNLAGRVFAEANHVLTNVAGRIEYNWKGSDGGANSRVSPFSVNISLLRFKVGAGPECGAPSAIDRNLKLIELPLDRDNYRIPVDWRDQLAPRQNKRFALSLVSQKSSHHLFRLVLELADGRALTSPKVDLTYFKPRPPEN